ncbi:restriction endonuclease S subunits [Thiohalobacter thiocyanaticus]|uniref:Restriction endonuclease S subunits n=1 Tax=Thiohalobacter thiocyanaticus TaxID=585455 RepID=A0A1Z4VS13_9GAMM|nr:restriction endonuclease subunit S [Thiohalobacter thiocyanaticus]BAZ94431.1 restriction endonuclease S subunits [Thiohalobacter thiocyanaticus]
MRPDWDWRALSDVCQIKPPKREAKLRLADDDLVSFVPMDQLGIREKQLRLTTDRRLSEVAGSYTYFAEGDVLLAKITPCFENGKLGIARGLTNGIGFGSSEFIVFRSGDELDPEFLFYFLSQDSFREAGASVMSGAVGHKRVPKEFIENHPIPLPSVAEQKRIVAILDETFAGIETAIANTEKNLANARELFESYLNSLFQVLDEKYSKVRFGDVCEFVRGPFGGSLKKSIFVPEGYAVYEQQHAINNQFDEVRYFVDGGKFQQMARFELKPGDLIMSCSGTMGKVSIAPSGLKRGIINQALLKLTPSNDVLSEFLKFWMESGAFLNEISKHSVGAAMKNVASVKVLKEIRVPMPPIDQQENIILKLNEHRQTTGELENIYRKKLSALAELKQSLLQKAFSGELTADKAEDEVQEAVA